jgi:hypothetical protein
LITVLKLVQSVGFPIFTAKNRYYIIIYCGVKIRSTGMGQKSLVQDMLHGAKRGIPFRK